MKKLLALALLIFGLQSYSYAGGLILDGGYNLDGVAIKEVKLIAPIGDSLTVGSCDDCVSPSEGYRHFLYNALVSKNDVKFYGDSELNAEEPWGRYTGAVGEDTATIEARVDAMLDSQFARDYNPADVHFLIHAGTNDIIDVSKTGCTSVGTTVTCSGGGLTGLEGKVVGKNANGWRTVSSVTTDNIVEVSSAFSPALSNVTMNVIQTDYSIAVDNVEDIIDMITAHIGTNTKIMVALIVPSWE